MLAESGAGNSFNESIGPTSRNFSVASRTCAKTDAVCALNCAIISDFDPVIDGSALETGGSTKGASSIVFCDDRAGFVITIASRVGPPAISSRRGVLSPNSGIGGDGTDFKIVGIAVGLGEGVDVDLGVDVGVGVAT